MHKIQPDIVIECGTFTGGSALFLASIFDIIGKGKVITIDIEDMENRPQHDRIVYLNGSSVAKQTIETIRSLIQAHEKVLVILDSDHSESHVLSEMREYSKFVTTGSYLIVEDTNIGGHPVFVPKIWSRHTSGPMEAVVTFLQENNDFKVDYTQEKFLLTFNPGGYLEKIK